MRNDDYTENIPNIEEENRRHCKYIELEKRRKEEPGYREEKNILKSHEYNYQNDEPVVLPGDDKEEDKDKVANDILAQESWQARVESILQEQEEQIKMAEEIAKESRVSTQKMIDGIFTENERLTDEILLKNNPQENVKKIIRNQDDEER